MNRNHDLLTFLGQRYYFTEVVSARWGFLTSLLRWRILGVMPFYSFSLRIPFLREKFLTVDWKVAERILEYPLLHQYLGRLDNVTNILDVGCAESRTSMELASLGYQVTGVDLRPYPLDHPRFIYIPADITHMPFQNGTFDFAVCISTLEHIGIPSYGHSGFSDGDKAAIAEICRCLKKGGYLYLTVPFGKGSITWQRIYDSVRLSEMLFSLHAVEVRYFRRNQQKYWDPCEASDLEENTSFPAEEGVNGLAVAFCRKEGA